MTSGLSQADISNIPDNTSEAQQALERALLHSEELYHFLQKHIQESQEISDQLVEFVKELLSANRALVEAFERAKKRQQFEKRQLKQEILTLTNRLHQST
uniref:Uncharacterized protein n=1 Tax=Amphimedon queenslandica TaxID=400682 RepID=A0A1X7T3V4_AMPQE